jgi:TrpR family trp operon transcriptional repressor
MQPYDTFIDLVYSIRDKTVLQDFLMSITTDSEREAFVKRIEIVKRLLTGEPQAQIAKELGVGIATVTRGSKELANGKFLALRREGNDESY